jgi:hypothetical protein
VKAQEIETMIGISRQRCTGHEGRHGGAHPGDDRKVNKGVRL